MICDDKARAAIEESLNMLVPWILMASYSYYHLDRPLLTDGYFDEMCQQLQFCWDMVWHRHKHLINLDELSAGTCLLRADKFPEITRDTVWSLLK